MVAMDEFVEDEVTVGVVAEVGGIDEFFEVETVVVEVSGHPDFAGVGEVDDLGVAKGGEEVLLLRGFEGFDGVIGRDGHRGIRTRMRDVSQFQNRGLGMKRYGGTMWAMDAVSGVARMGTIVCMSGTSDQKGCGCPLFAARWDCEIGLSFRGFCVIGGGVRL
jgi:hypothetical protein